MDANKQNFRIGSEEYTRNIHEKPTQSKRVTVWCALWSVGVIGPYIFENPFGGAVLSDFGLRGALFLNRLLFKA